MYPPQQHQPKLPIPIRPRSSLSTDEHHHRLKETHRLSNKPSNTVLTLAGFCIFLLVLCVFLLGALVYVGKNIVNEQNNKGACSLRLINVCQCAKTIQTKFVEVLRKILLRYLIRIITVIHTHLCEI